MICTARPLPVTGFPSDHITETMSRRQSRSPHLKEGKIPVRTALPQEPSKSDIESGQQSDINPYKNGQHAQSNDTPSPRYDSETQESPNTQRLGTPNSILTDQMQREDSTFAPVIAQSESIPSGQVCR